MGYGKNSGVDNSLNVNYLQVIPNSHYWTDLNQIINGLDSAPQDMTKDYLLIGLGNTIKNGYKLKPMFKDAIKVATGNPIFTTLQQMVDYISSDDYMDKVFYVTLVATVGAEINLSNGRKLERPAVYQRINGERDYQDSIWGVRRDLDGTPDEEKPVAEWINYIEYHLAKAKEKVYHLDTQGALAEIRKVTALGVRTIEIHGCPERQPIVMGKVIAGYSINDTSAGPSLVRTTTSDSKDTLDMCCGDCKCDKK
jgi:hypothetical protein